MKKDLPETNLDQVGVVFTPHALQSLQLRGISAKEVGEVLLKGLRGRTDIKTGRIIYRLGGLRVVTKRQGKSIVVLGAIKKEEFSEHAIHSA